MKDLAPDGVAQLHVNLLTAYGGAVAAEALVDAYLL